MFVFFFLNNLSCDVEIVSAGTQIKCVETTGEVDLEITFEVPTSRGAELGGHLYR